jgi:molybdopterin/thiamine biosynthesis adenylyltransferase
MRGWRNMAHVIQVGAGSGGMPVLDMLIRSQQVKQVTLIEPDIYKPHNFERHLLPPSAIGELKAEAARQWLVERRPALEVRLITCDLTDASAQPAIEQAISAADICVCAVDNEPAKYHWDALMRRHGKPWTLGEVLSGGIGGFVHWFTPGGPCYGCVASTLKREVVVDRPAAPDYSHPGGPIEEATVPAGIASIHAIASLHALVTLDLLEQSTAYDPGFTTMLLTLQRVPGVFEEPYRPFKFRIDRSPQCLICGAAAAPVSARGEELDAAVDEALTRLDRS